MTSQARIDTNRQNAQLSTGPRTEQGKQASSRNATKHGFFQRLLPIETPAFQDMLTGLYHTFRPADEIQQLLVDQIGIAYLRLARLYQQELNGAESCVETRQVASSSGDSNGQGATQHSTLMLRYETMLTRQIERNFKVLNDARDLRRYFGRMLDQPPPFLPGFAREDLAAAPATSDDDAPGAAESAQPLAVADEMPVEDTPQHRSETPLAQPRPEPMVALSIDACEPDPSPRPQDDPVAIQSRASAAKQRLRAGVQAPSCADDSQIPSRADESSIDDDDDHPAQHEGRNGTQHPTLTPSDDRLTWLPGNLHQIDPVSGLIRFRHGGPR